MQRRSEKIRIAYIGSLASGSTSRQKKNAFERIGGSVVSFDPKSYLSSGKWQQRYNYLTGYRFVSEKLGLQLEDQVRAACELVGESFDLIWVDSGEWLGPKQIRSLRKFGSHIALYNHDDPTGPRDRNRFYTLRRAISEYDLCIVVRDESAYEFQRIGGRTLQSMRTYDEVEHAPLPHNDPRLSAASGELNFVGTCIPGEGRDEFLYMLDASGVGIKFWGSRWERSANWAKIKHAYQGGAIQGEDYVAAVQAPVCTLGLLSSLNRDQHTTRSLEVPFAGGLLCAERTPEHEKLLGDMSGALLWSNFAECVDRVIWARENSEKAALIRAEGRRRVIEAQCGNEHLLRRALASLGLAE